MFIRVSEHNNNLKLHYGCRIRDMTKWGRKPKSVKEKNEKKKWKYFHKTLNEDKISFILLL